MSIFVTGLLVTFLLSLLLALTKHWHAHWSVDSREAVQKFHIEPTPRVGGIAIFVGVLITALTADIHQQRLIFPLIFASMPAFAFGLLEDITKRVSIRTRLLATMSSGLLGWALTGLSITDAQVIGLDWLLGFTVVSVLFTCFAVGGIANAINIIDGFNGLAAGSSIIIFAGLGWMAWSVNDPNLAGICLILAGCVAGFLLVNWPFGKLFLGDGGAYFVGFAMAWVSVLLLARHQSVSAWAPLLVCAYPILEVVFSIARRLLPSSSNLVRNSLTSSMMWLGSIATSTNCRAIRHRYHQLTNWLCKLCIFVPRGVFALDPVSMALRPSHIAFRSGLSSYPI